MISYIAFEYVLKVHDQLIREYGGAQGVLHEGLLKSALEMPKARFDKRDLHRTIFDKTAAYLFHIIKNHPFVDGNGLYGCYDFFRLKFSQSILYF
jgi:death-on-curing protein